jgi:hypothetical protein
MRAAGGGGRFLPIVFGYVLLALPGCNRLPDAYAPPEQVVMPTGPEPTVAPGSGWMVAMSDPDADVHIVSDVFRDAGSEWAFTGLHPKFRFTIRDGTRVNFYVRFFNHDEALRARGPVSFTITINGHDFQSPRFTGSGNQEYRTPPLPNDWIVAPGLANVSLDIEPPWHAGSGTVYGVLLNSIGFEAQ